MKTITGTPARKDKFFNRPKIRQQLIESIQNGENILISAPRRVGKSSILLDLVDSPEDNFYPVFIDTEAIDNAETFFKTILHAILDADKIENFKGFSKKDREKLGEWVNRIASFKIGNLVEVKVDKAPERSFYEKFIEFLTEYKIEDRQILLMIDEFPITVENIVQKSGPDAAINFLSQNRAIRQNPLFHEKIKVVYTGSIGLFTAVKKIGATDRINDVREVHIGPLNQKEAALFFTELMKETCRVTPNEEMIGYTLQKIEWWIPFYFQLLVRELSHLLDDEQPLTTAIINESFSNVIKHGDIYFEHFKSRLAKIFKSPEELAFVNALLLLLKKDSWVNINTIVNLANDEKYKAQNQLDSILEILIHDGYIVKNNNSYNFYSPILKAWWK